MEKKSLEKTGAARFFTILFGEFRELVELNLLFCACVLPSAALFTLGLFGYFSWISFLLSVVAAYPSGGAVTAYSFCIAKMLRGEYCSVRDDYKRKFFENVRQAAAPGILCSAFIYAQIYFFEPFLFEGAGIDATLLITGIVISLIFGMIAPYIFLQLAYVNLKIGQIVMNSVLISFANAPRSIMGAVSSSVIWIAFVLLFPGSLAFTPVLFLIGFSLSRLLCLTWVWPPMNRQFHIDEILRQKDAAANME